jgi:hypothetical protein
MTTVIWRQVRCEDYINDKQGGGGSHTNIFVGTIQAWARDNLGHHDVLKTLAHGVIISHKRSAIFL